MRVLLLSTIDTSKFAGAGPAPPEFDGCPIPSPQPQAFWWKALRDLGHDVAVIPFVPERWPGLPVNPWLARRAVAHVPGLMKWAGPAPMYVPNLPPVRAFHRALEEAAQEFKPDVFITTGNIPVLRPEAVKSIKRLGAAAVLIKGMPLVTHRCKNEIEFAEYLDLAVVNDPHHELDWKLCGCPRTACLPISACEPEFHRPIPQDDPAVARHTSNISFIGSFEPRVYYGMDRLPYLEAVADLGLAIYSSTPGPLASSPRLRACWRGQARQCDIPAIISGSKINLNVLARAMPGGGNYRTFEIAGCGGFQMCDRFQRQWFEEGKEIAGFSTPGDLREKVMAYLQCDRERATIAAASRARAVREHTFKDRFESLFTILGEGGR